MPVNRGRAGQGGAGWGGAGWAAPDCCSDRTTPTAHTLTGLRGDVSLLSALASCPQVRTGLLAS